jgi:ABC-2 type transport system permease protein
MTASLQAPLRKWLQLYGLFFQDAIVYRANAVIWLMTDTVPSVLMPLVWLASYNHRPTIGGFTPSQMVVYYIVVLFLTCAVESHIMWDISNDIKAGLFNVWLTRPVNYMAAMYASNVSWRLMRTVIFIPLFFAVVAVFHQWVRFTPNAYDLSWRFWLAVVLGHVVSFLTSYSMGLIALTVVEARSLYNFYYLPLVIFNGQIAPLSCFPPAIAHIAYMLPFGYTIAFPAQVFLKHVSEPMLLRGYAMQVMWIALAAILARTLWRIGLKRYTAYGI